MKVGDIFEDTRYNSWRTIGVVTKVFEDSGTAEAVTISLRNGVLQEVCTKSPFIIDEPRIVVLTPDRLIYHAEDVPPHWEDWEVKP